MGGRGGGGGVHPTGGGGGGYGFCLLLCPVLCVVLLYGLKTKRRCVCWEATPHVGRVDVVFAACCPACPDPCVVLQYGLKKKEVHVEEEPDPMSEGRVGRKKKTPAELAAENNPDSDDDEFASKFSSLCCCMNFV